jgi:UDP-N-acetylmuramoyl-tripeptide--D-alanyl-D-alanine ligase
VAVLFPYRKGGWLVREVCGEAIDRAALEASLRLGTDYLLAQQKPAGNFVYEYDWVGRREPPGDSQVRQAGAVWGLSLVHLHRPEARVARALERAFGFFAQHARRGPNGALLPAYPGEPQGELGTLALLALAHVDYLRAAGGAAAGARVAPVRRRLDELVATLLSLRTPEGLFHSYYDLASGAPSGEPNPYGDGEALLALAKAARYLGRDDLRPALVKGAEAALARHVTSALERDRDSDETKGFYQWGSMAFYELATGPWPEFAPYADAVLRLADWQLDVHHVLEKLRNTGYAFEGILHALDLARRRGDAARAERYRCVAAQGLERLTGWQVGGPLPNGYVRDHGPPEDRARGGVQNGARDPVLRIDVTQHQMHAVALALTWLFPADARAAGASSAGPDAAGGASAEGPGADAAGGASGEGAGAGSSGATGGAGRGGAAVGGGGAAGGRAAGGGGGGAAGR